MASTRNSQFNPQTFLTKAANGNRSLTAHNKQILFSQGDAAEAVFYIQSGTIKLTVVSPQGKEAVVAMLEPGAFFGEGCLAAQLVYTATATAMEDSTLVRIDKQAMIRYSKTTPLSPRCSSRISWLATFASKRTWWINSLIPARSGWRGSSC